MLFDHEKINHLPKLFLLFFTLSFIALYFIYSPVLHIPFYHHDIYKFSVGGLDKVCSEDYGYKNIYTQIRPIVALLDCLHFKLAHSLQNMSYLRFECIVLASLFASLFACWLTVAGFTFWFSLLSSVMIFCLPGIQTGMIMGADFLILTPLLVFIAYLFVEKSFRSHQHSIFFMVIGFLCLLTSFFIYPALSSFYLVPVMITVLFKPLQEWNQTRKFVLRHISVFMTCSVIFMLLAKLIQSYFISSDFPGGYAFNLPVISAIFKRLLTIFKIFPSLWNINYHSVLQAVIVYIVVIIGSILSVRKFMASEFYRLSAHPLNKVVQSTIAVFILLGLGGMAYLAMPSDMIFTRILFVFQVMSLFIVIWAAMKICDLFMPEKKAFLISIVTLFFVGGAAANSIITKSALNDNIELNYMTSHLSEPIIHGEKIKHIHVVGLQFDANDNFNGMTQRDDIFNINSTLYRQDAFYMIKAALNQIAQPGSFSLYNCGLDEFQLMHITVQECMHLAPKNSIIVTYSRQGEPVISTPNTLVINMTDESIYFPKNPKLKLQPL